MGDALGGAAGGAAANGTVVPGGYGGQTFVEGTMPPGGYGGGIDSALGTQAMIQRMMQNAQGGSSGSPDQLAPRPEQAMQLQQMLPNLHALMPSLLGRPGPPK